MAKWGVLAVLGAAQFLMVLDQAVMNVAISQLVEDFDTTVTTIQIVIALYALVMAGLMLTGGKLGDLWGRKRAFVDRPLHLRHRVGADGGLLERAEPHLRLVDPRGHRRRPRPAGDGRPRRHQLQGPGAGARLRRARRRRRSRDRGRPDPRRLGDDGAQLAGRLRRRGRGRPRDHRRHAPAEGAGEGARRRPRRRRRRPLGEWARDHGLRRPPGEQLGLAAAAQLADRRPSASR